MGMLVMTLAEGDEMVKPTPADVPLLSDKDHAAASVFVPEGLLREARRQKGLAEASVPPLCVLDPDGDLVRRLKAHGRARADPAWACYHTEMVRLKEDGLEIGIVGCAVGAPFAVLIAEQLFVSGCRLLISITSAGQLVPLRPPPYFVLIERALRDEGTSHHYVPPSRYSEAPSDLVEMMRGGFGSLGIPVVHGGSWTTDAPFRETAEAIASRRAEGLLAVEMEAAALYAFAKARGKSVLCFALVTNQMAQIEGDFEKGESDGSMAALALVRTVAARLMP
jgi:uridine phosphorylase